MKYDVIIIGAGPGGIFSAYELMQKNKNLRVAVFEADLWSSANVRLTAEKSKAASTASPVRL